MLDPVRRLLVGALVLLAAVSNAAAGVIGAHPVTRIAFRALLSSQLQQYMSLPPAEGLRRLESLTVLPSAQYPALAVDRVAASAALALIVSPQAVDLSADRETRVVLSRVLGKANVALIATAADELKTRAAHDPALSGAVEHARSLIASPQGADIAWVRAGLKKFFDGDSSHPAFPDQAPPVALILPPGGGLTPDVTVEGTGFVYKSPDDSGLTRRYKVYPQDAVTFERREIPTTLADIYEELPGGAIRQKAPDPLVAALYAANIELWTVRHGETDDNRAGVLAGSGTDAALTKTPNGPDASGEAQARSAALTIYENLGGDEWARGVLIGIQKPLVILMSPMKRTRQTASALQMLLDERARTLGNAPRGALYEAHVERGLAEIAFGEFEGLPIAKAETLASWPAFDDISGAGRTFLDRFPKGESRLDVMIRQRGVLRRMVKDYPGRKIVTFTHRVTITAQMAILALIDHDPADGAMRAAPAKNALPIQLTFPSARLLDVPH
ncbi:MAG: histidine phosphatase family protein [Elusimicrobiota bacterium]